MSFGSASKYNSRQPTNKSGQIVGASFPSKSAEGAKVKSTSAKQNQKASSIAPSEEFRVFWGNNVDPSWFEGKRPVSPFIIFISLLVILNIYLCSNLLFSPGEIQEIFTAPDTDYESSQIDQRLSGLQTIDDEKMLLEGVSNKESKKSSKNTKSSKIKKSKKSSTKKTESSRSNDKKTKDSKSKKSSRSSRSRSQSDKSESSN